MTKDDWKTPTEPRLPDESARAWTRRMLNALKPQFRNPKTRAIADKLSFNSPYAARRCAKTLVEVARRADYREVNKMTHVTKQISSALWDHRFKGDGSRTLNDAILKMYGIYSDAYVELIYLRQFRTAQTRVLGEGKDVQSHQSVKDLQALETALKHDEEDYTGISENELPGSPRKGNYWLKARYARRARREVVRRRKKLEVERGIAKGRHGMELAKSLQKKRTPQARGADSARTSRHLLRNPTHENIEDWHVGSGYDIKDVDDARHGAKGRERRRKQE